jgi:hypothetical protein
VLGRESGYLGRFCFQSLLTAIAARHANIKEVCMKASELVSKLNDAIKEHGDIEVELDDAEWGPCEINAVVLDKDRRLFNVILIT